MFFIWVGNVIAWIAVVSGFLKFGVGLLVQIAKNTRAQWERSLKATSSNSQRLARYGDPAFCSHPRGMFAGAGSLLSSMITSPTLLPSPPCRV